MTRDELKKIIRDTVEAFPHDACHTCDCFQGFLTQCEIDADEDVHDIINTYIVTRDVMHSCLGCDPCPPGAAYAAYLKRTKGDT